VVSRRPGWSPRRGLAVGLLGLIAILAIGVSSAAAKRAGRAAEAGADVCQLRYPSGVQKTVGRTTRYDRQASLYQVCEGFGSPADSGFTLTPTQQCAIIAAAATYGGPVVDAGVSTGCETGDVIGQLAGHHWLGAAKTVGCAYFTDIFAGSAGLFAAGLASPMGPGAVAVGVATYHALAASLKLVCGGVVTAVGNQLGRKLESRHETAVALDILRKGKCLTENRRRILGIQWSAVTCPESAVVIPLDPRAILNNIVREGGSGTAYYVTTGGPPASSGTLWHWIPDGGTYSCLVADGARVIPATWAQINELRGAEGQHEGARARCPPRGGALVITGIADLVLHSGDGRRAAPRVDYRDAACDVVGGTWHDANGDNHDFDAGGDAAHPAACSNGVGYLTPGYSSCTSPDGKPSRSGRYPETIVLRDASGHTSHPYTFFLICQ
jgi:hypothetical protein